MCCLGIAESAASVLGLPVWLILQALKTMPVLLLGFAGMQSAQGSSKALDRLLHAVGMAACGRYGSMLPVPQTESILTAQ